MSFFSRPNLEDVQFRQIPDSELTLSGTTKFVNVSGLTLTDNNGGFIPVAADTFDGSAPTHGMALAFDSTVNRIRLMDISGGTSTDVYLGASPTTITVGGLEAGTDIYNTGITKILEMILTPAQSPSIGSFGQTLTVTPSTTLYEVGAVINLNRSVSFSRGSVSPNYEENTGNELITPKFRVGAPMCYIFTGTINPTTIISTSTSISNNVSNVTIQQGNNTISSRVCYSAGEDIYNSVGDLFLSAAPSSATTTSTFTISGIYPWFYGTYDGSEIPDLSDSAVVQDLIDNGNKCVGSSTGNISINFNVDSPDKFLWFATPASSPNKTRWSGSNNPSNVGTIPGLVFLSHVPVNIDSPDNCWSSQNYKIYITDYATNTEDGGQFYTMTFCN